MKKLSVLALLLLLMPFAADAAVRKTARTSARAAAKIDYNCSDFTTQTQAQNFFIQNGGPARDPYRLDGDKDGIACEDLKK